MTTTPLGEAAPALSAGALRLPARRTLRLRDGRSVRVRPIQAADAEALREFDGGLCEACHRFRYDNARMMRALRRIGFRRTAWELGVVTFTRTLPATGAAAPVPPYSTDERP